MGEYLCWRITLTADAKEATDITTDANKIKTLSGDSNADYLFVELTVTKKVGDAAAETLTSLSDLITVTMEVPEAYRSANMRIFRVHDGAAQELPQTEAKKNSDGEYFTLNADFSIATLHVMNFSTYAMSLAVTPTSGGSTYSITALAAKNGKVAVSPTNAISGATVTVTVTPDKGYTLETLTVTDVSGKAVATTKNSNGTYSFTMPSGKVTVAATFMEDNTMLNHFVDVPTAAYYYDAVLWAAEKGITSGTDATHFDPNGVCTRAQAVTFLWRANGSPEPTTADNPFADVSADAYYYKAVLWAVEKGITEGTTTTTFSPDAVCSRSQIVTFQYRAALSPTTGTVNPFTDVADSAYYANAVLWAVKEGITQGTTATTFSPNDDCTRAQIVTFIFRQLGK